LKRAILPLVGLLLITAMGPAAADEVAQGHTLYQEHCASCHGLAGEETVQ